MWAWVLVLYLLFIISNNIIMLSPRGPHQNARPLYVILVNNNSCNINGEHREKTLLFLLEKHIAMTRASPAFLSEIFQKKNGTFLKMKLFIQNVRSWHLKEFLVLGFWVPSQNFNVFIEKIIIVSICYGLKINFLTAPNYHLIAAWIRNWSMQRANDFLKVMQKVCSIAKNCTETVIMLFQ